MTRFSDRKIDMIFSIAEHVGKMADVPDGSNPQEVAQQTAHAYAEDYCFVEHGEAVAITPFQQQVYAAGFMSGYKERKGR